MKLAFISGAYPPDLDGIADYTWWIAQTLAKCNAVGNPVTVFTRIRGEYTPAAGVRVVPFFDPSVPSSFRNLLSSGLRSLISDLDWLVLQYNPFCYGRRGYCPWVPRTLRLIKRSCTNVKIAVMFHETYVPAEGFRFRVMRTWQRLQVKAIVRVMDLGLAATERWAQQVDKFSPRSKCRVLPVGSNLPRCLKSQQLAREALGFREELLLVGLFGSHHVSRLLEWVKRAVAAMEQKRTLALVYVGKDGPKFRNSLAGLKSEFFDFGSLPAAEAANHLAAMDVLLCPFSDGVSARRGSMIAGLQNGVAVVANRGPSTDSILTETAMWLSRAGDCDDFVAKACEIAMNDVERHRVALAGKQFFDEHFAWERLADSLMEVLTKQAP